MMRSGFRLGGEWVFCHFLAPTPYMAVGKPNSWGLQPGDDLK